MSSAVMAREPGLSPFPRSFGVAACYERLRICAAPKAALFDDNPLTALPRRFATTEPRPLPVGSAIYYRELQLRASELNDIAVLQYV